MKIILILLLTINFNFIFAADGASTITESSSSGSSSDFVGLSQSESETLMTDWENERLSVVEKFTNELNAKALDINLQSKYLDTVTFLTANVSDITCPNLKLEYKDRNLHVRITGLNLLEGEIECSVFNNTDKLTALEVKKVKYPKILEKINKYTIAQSKIDESAKESRNLYTDKIAAISAATSEDSLFTNSSSSSTSKKILNNKDLMIASMQLNNEIIDIQETIESGVFTLQPTYVTYSNEISYSSGYSSLLNDIRKIAQDLLDDNGYEILNPFSKPTTENEYYLQATDRQDTFMTYLTYTVVNFGTINASIIDIIHILTYIIMGYTIITRIYNIVENKQSQNDNFWLILGIEFIFVSALAFFNNSEAYRLEKVKTIQEEIDIKSYTSQHLTASTFNYFDTFADNLSKKFFQSYLNTFANQNNIYTTAQIEEQERLQYRYNNELEQLQNVVYPQCLEQYNISSLVKIQNSSNLQEYDRGDSKNDITNFIFPSNEAALNKILFPERIYKKNFEDYITPPKDTRSVYDKPVQVLEEKYYKSTDDEIGVIDDAILNIYSISACGYVKKRIDYLSNQITTIDRNIDDFNNKELFEKEKERIEKLHTFAGTMFQQHGRYSVALIPVLESLQSLTNNAIKKAEKYKGMVFYSNTGLEQLAQMAIEKVWFLVFFDVSHVMSMIEKMSSILTSWIPFFGTLADKTIAIVSTLVLVDILVDLVQYIKIPLQLFLITAIFIVQDALRWILIIISPIFLAYVFVKNKFDYIRKPLSHYLYFAIVPFLTVFAIIILLVSNYLLDSIFGDMFYSAQQLIEITISNWLGKTVSGFFAAIILILKILFTLIYTYFMIVNLPRIIFNWFFDNVSDSVVDAVQSHKLQNKLGA